MKAIDPRSLRPSEAAALLNSTPLETVVTERHLRRWREAAGARVCAAGSLTHIDLVKLAAWLVLRRSTAAAAEKGQGPGLAGYEKVKDEALRRRLELSKTARDIGPLPAVRSPERKEACRRDFRKFCETYLPRKFYLGWSADHLLVIATIQRVVLEGGQFVIAMPRGSGKSALCEAGLLWAALYGHHEFMVLVGEGLSASIDCLDSVKAEITDNPLIAEDYPEVAFPVARLEGINQRAAGQTLDGRRTLIRWNEDQVVLPTVKGSDASAVILQVAGLEGRIRGMKFTRPDGRTVRPGLVFVDDPQNDESARSPMQVATREAIIQGAVLGLAGPGAKLSALAAVTVIQVDDLAERLLDHDKHPEWQGRRCKLLYSMPAAEDLWDQYAKIRREAIAAGDDPDLPCNEFYAEHRAKLEAGAVVGWEARKRPTEITALQHAMNLKIDRGDAVFHAEFQNDPAAALQLDVEALKPGQIMSRLNGVPRGTVPMGAQYLTAFIDVQAKCLFWMVCAWTDDMTGSIIEYGTEPDQAQPYFALREVRRTLERAAPGAGLEAAVRAGLERLFQGLFSRAWPIDGGGAMSIGRAMVDANWSVSTEVVYQLCRSSPYSGILIPSHGKGVTAANKPMSHWARKPGDRTGVNWRIPVSVGSREVRHCLYDTNWWKSCVYARLRTKLGDRGALWLFGKDAQRHRMLADQLTAETPTMTAGHGRHVAQWALRQPGLDNHWLDCLVGCAVAANMLGATPPGLRVESRPKVSFGQLQRARRTRPG